MKHFVSSFLIFLSCSSGVIAQPSLDATFGTGGYVDNFGLTASDGSVSEDVVVQPDGKILQAGISFNAGNESGVIVRTLSNGLLDNTFGTGGKFIFDFGGTNTRFISMALLTDGKILVGGENESEVFVLRLLPNGQIDNTFGGVNSYFRTNFISFPLLLKKVLVQTDGKIVMTGNIYNGFDWDIFSFRIDSLGTTYDMTYGAGGIYQFAESLEQGLIGAKLDESNRTLFFFSYDSITTEPYKTNYCVGRIKSDGTLDATFGTAGIYKDAILNANTRDNGDLIITTDQKILITGSHYNASGNYDAFICRLTSNGVLDNTFNSSGRVLVDYSSGDEEGFEIIEQADGQIVLGGVNDNPSDDYYFLARFSPTGLPDLSFGPMGRYSVGITSQTDMANALTFQQDGKLLFSGYKINMSMMGSPSMLLARFILVEDFSVSEMNDSDPKIQFYPNPADNQIFISTSDKFTLQLITIDGKVLFERNIEEDCHIDISYLNSGLYLLKSKENIAWSRKLIKR